MMVAVMRSSFDVTSHVDCVYSYCRICSNHDNEVLILAYHQVNENKHIQSSSLPLLVRTICLSSTAIQYPAPPRLVASRSPTNAATGYSVVVTPIPAAPLAVPRVATRADTPNVAVCSADTMKTRLSQQPRSRSSAPSRQRKRPITL